MTKAAELAKMGEVLTNSQIGGRRNLIINGAMQVAQRGTSTTGVTSGGYYGIDRFRLTTTAEQTETHAQVSDAPSGFTSSYKVTVTTADSSIDASDFAAIQQKIEAQDLQHLKFGTSDAEKLTVSFYVKASATGTFAVGMTQDDADSGTSEISQNYTISSADTWEYKTLTFNGNTSDAIDNNNGSGLQLNFFYTAGSDLTSGTLNSYGDNAHRAIGHTANLVGTLNATFQITGVQLEVGEQATPFEHRSFGDELALCQRYFQKYSDNGSNHGYLTTGNINGTRFYGVMRWTITMRATPTVSTTGSGFGIQSQAHSATGFSIDETHNPTVDAVRLRTGTSSNFTNGQGATLRFSTTASLTADAEL